MTQASRVAEGLEVRSLLSAFNFPGYILEAANHRSTPLLLLSSATCVLSQQDHQ